MKVKNGIASSVSLCMIAEDAQRQRLQQRGWIRPSSMPTKPKNRPQAARENATG